MKKDNIDMYLKEDEVPPFPIHSNWREMTTGPEFVEGKFAGKMMFSVRMNVLG